MRNAKRYIGIFKFLFYVILDRIKKKNIIILFDCLFLL